MVTTDKKGDLHIHTRLSDGSLLLEDVLLIAKRSGMNYISITNHDVFTDISTIVELAKSIELGLINGIEISSIDNVRGRRVHILCYLPKRIDEIEIICENTICNRTKAGSEMVEKVSKLYPIIQEDVERIACHSACIYKQHIMRALMNAGYTTQIFGKLYDELFSFESGSCIVNCILPDVYDVLEAVKQSGGVAVIAHPYTYNSIDLMCEVIEKGYLDGIEVWSSKSSKEQEDYLFSITEKYNLIPTGGSDFHGAYGSRVSPIGKKVTPQSSIESIMALSKVRT